MKTWKTIDKSEWPQRGEWDTEPDKAQWIDEKTGLDCLIVRGPTGALCGYVGVPESNTLFEKDYDTVDVDVHGGLTFSDRCRPVDEASTGICHTGEVANKIVWWLGFDCAHAGDLMPKYDRVFTDYDFYRNFGYVKSQVTSLASQVAQ